MVKTSDERASKVAVAYHDLAVDSSDNIPWLTCECKVATGENDVYPA